MRSRIGVMGAWLLCPVVCLASLPPAQARDVTGVAGVNGYRAQVYRILKARIGHLRHGSPGGTVALRFTIDRDGLVTRSEVAASSGSESTDRLALSIVPVGLRLPPLPAQARLPDLTVTVPVRFPSSDAAIPDSLKAYRREVTQILLYRVRNLPHRLLTGGLLHVRFTIGRDGVVTRSEITRSAGYRYIDDLGLRIVPVGLKLPPLPADGPSVLTVTQPLSFGLAPNGS